MLRKQYMVSLLVVLFSLIFVGVAMAGENDYKGILGSDQFGFESAETNMAASTHVYDQERLVLIGTEAGAWEYNPNAELTPVQQAAIERDFEHGRMSDVGTEAGSWQYGFDSSGPANSICSSC